MHTLSKRTIILLIALIALVATAYFKSGKKYEYIFFEYKMDLSRPVCRVDGPIYVQIYNKIKNKPDKVYKPNVRLDSCKYIYFQNEVYMVCENLILLQKNGKDMTWYFEDNIEKKLLLLLNEKLGQKTNEKGNMMNNE